jgi:hypothetical protein
MAPFMFNNFRLAEIPPPEPEPPMEPLDIGLLWMICGDSQTEGRVPGDGPSDNPGKCFMNIWNENENAGADITTFTNLGQGGSSLASTNSRYNSSGSRMTRTWVHTQESGSQSGDGGSQDTAAKFKAVFKDHIRDIYANTPDAIISYETPNSFDRTGDRNWDGAYETALREAIDELYDEDEIRVYLAEVNAIIEALEVYSSGGITIAKSDVWYTNPVDPLYAHYTALGNFAVALAMFCALGYDPTGYTFSSITDVTADQKTAAIACIQPYIPGA